jgi:hypothetical protein
VAAVRFQKRKRSPTVGSILLRWRKPKANPRDDQAPMMADFLSGTLGAVVLRLVCRLLPGMRGTQPADLRV